MALVVELQRNPQQAREIIQRVQQDDPGVFQLLLQLMQRDK
jgi:hypothetical protein